MADRSVLLLFLTCITEEPAETVGGVIPPHGPGGKTHFAFAVAKEDFTTWQAELSAKQIESVVNWPGGARSMYFRAPDENLVELLIPGFWVNY